MTIDEILTLGKMGYTKEEIEALNKPAKEPEPTKEPEPAKEPELVSEPEPKKEPAADPTKDLLKFMAGEFDKLNKSIQNSNILGSNINQPKAKTAEEVLAELIAPPTKKEVK